MTERVTLVISALVHCHASLVRWARVFLEVLQESSAMESNAGDIKEAADRWLASKMSDEIPIAQSFLEFMKSGSEVPEFYLRDLDLEWRDGFRTGFVYCIEKFIELYKEKGFVRVSEIANMLSEWNRTVLSQWDNHGEGKVKSTTGQDHPAFDWPEKWSEIRDRIIRRYGSCVRCGDVLRLEVDHIVDVQHGGLPVDGNLRTLCKFCHTSKRIWSNT